MKTLKFRIPRTAASITALIDSLNDELAELDNEIIVPGATSAADDKTDGDEQDNTGGDNVVTLNTGNNTVVIKPGEKGTGAAGVIEVDADGIPWDARIHASSRATLKRGGTWKLARSVDETLVNSVIEELKQTMAVTGSPAESEEKVVEDNTTAASAPAPAPSAPAPAPAPSAPAPAPAASKPDPIYIVEGSGEFTAEQLKASGWTDEQIETLPVKQVEAAPAAGGMTFPELMAKITGAGLDETDVLTAVNNHGIQALPLLAARPDLIPAVHDELFPE